MEVTRELLAKAVDGMEVVVDLLGHDIPGVWTGAKIRYPESFAAAVFARLADLKPERDQKPPTREHLVRAELPAVFGRCHVEIQVSDATAPYADGYPTDESAAKLAALAEREFAARAAESPAELADELARSPIAADPELSVIARILTELRALDGETGAGRDSALRALCYVADRYGYDLHEIKD